MATVVGSAFFGGGGDASRKTSFPLYHHHHPQRHARHDDNSRHGSKSGRWPFKKSAVEGKKTVACSGSSKRAMKKRCYIMIRNKLITFCSFLCEYIKRTWKRTRQVTPTAKRNTYSVAMLVGILPRVACFRPQPWAGKAQLLQSCRGCVLSSDEYGQIYLGGYWLTMMDGTHPMLEWCLPMVCGAHTMMG